MMNINGINRMTDKYSDYLRDESRTEGFAESISFPTCEEELCRILSACNATGTGVTVQGARTGLAAAAVPRGGHILNLSGMKKIKRLRRSENGAYLLTVEPGVVLSELRGMIADRTFNIPDADSITAETLAAFSADKKYFFSPDPTESSATLGGMAACNASGARSFKYGATREHIEALRVVLADGDILAIRRGEVSAHGRKLELETLGGRKISVELPAYTMPDCKCASGYYIKDNMDAVDLFIGSDGTLGAISELEIKLIPAPGVIFGVNCFFESEALATDFVCRVRKLREIAAVEYFDADAMEILMRQKQSGGAFAKLPDVKSGMGAAVYAELHCADKAEALERLFAIGDIMEEVGGGEHNTWVAGNERDLDTLIFFRHAVPESVNMEIDRMRRDCSVITKLGSDMAVPDNALDDVIKLYRTTLEKYGLKSAIWGHIGNNHLHVNIIARNEREYITGKAVNSEWARQVSRLGGAVSAEHGIGKNKTAYLELMYGQGAIAEMKRLKSVFDEKGILGIGNMFALK